MKRIRLGDLLLEKKLVDEKTLEKASLEQTKSGKKFGQTLIEMGVIKEADLLNLLADQLDVPFIDLKQHELNERLIPLLPETQARRYRAIILGRSKDNSLLVGMADPLDIFAFDELSKLLKQPISMAIVSEQALLATIDRVYSHSEEITQFAKQLSGELVNESSEITDTLFKEASGSAEEAPVVKLLNTIFSDAIRVGASDIHIEPGEKNLHIRLRIDGVLQENVLDDKRIARALIQRLKLRANLDISEKRLPQDGRFHLVLGERSFDVRLSTLTTANGESVVMRLLDQSSPVQGLDKLGIDDALVSALRKIYHNPHGMLLVTGPTGSGKTTTLYGILSELNESEKKIITVEDPVEYRLERVNQVQVNHKIDLTFARVLRAILRQDPDIIMIGEIRDKETANIALRASVTGHFVLATLHTNDSISTATRLIDMGCEGFMVASSVKGILAQRLVRGVCEVCVDHYHPTEGELAWLEALGVKETSNLKVGLGCTYCNQTGYKGRLGVYELLVLDYPMLEALRQMDSVQFIKLANESPFFKPLKESVLNLLLAGKSTVSEAMRVLGQELS